MQIHNSSVALGLHPSNTLSWVLTRMQPHSRINIKDKNKEKQKGKMSAVSQGIAILDTIRVSGFDPSLVRNLYLSNNFISDLQKIGQFINVESLSLGYNQISELPQLRYLLLLPKLKVVCFEGNPITTFPIYLPYLLGVTNGLKSTDTGPVSQQLLNHAATYWSSYEQIMKKLIINYSRLGGLVQRLKKQKINATIKQANSELQHQFCNQTTDPQSPPIYSPDNEKWRNCLLKYLEQGLKESQQQILDYSSKYLVKLEHLLIQDTIKIMATLPTYNNQFKENNSIAVNTQHRLNPSSILQKQKYNRSAPNDNKSQRLEKFKKKEGGLEKVEVFLQAMQMLLEKQRQKQQELTTRVSIPMGPSLCPADVQTVKSKLELVLLSSGQHKQELLYYGWKLINRVFFSLKQYVQHRNNRRNAVSNMIKILERSIKKLEKDSIDSVTIFLKRKSIAKGYQLITEVQQSINRQFFQTFFHRLKNYNNFTATSNKKSETKEPNRIEVTLPTNQTHPNPTTRMPISHESLLLQRHFQTSYENSAQEQQYQQTWTWKLIAFRKNKEEKKLVSRCWGDWVRLHVEAQLFRQNRVLLAKLKEKQQLETRFMRKIQLLEQIQQITSQKDLPTKSPFPHSPPRASPTSPKSAHVLPPPLPQNIKIRTPSSPHKLQIQRKYNSSRNKLRLD